MSPEDKMLMHEALERCGLRWPKGGKLTCPLHKDKQPSLQLYRDSFYCFSCQANGDSYGFIAMWKGSPIGDVLKQYAAPQEQNPILRPSRQTIIEVGPQAMNERQHRQWRELNSAVFGKLHQVFHDLSTQILVEEIERMGDQFEELGYLAEGVTGFEYDTMLREFKQEQFSYLDRADARLNGWQLGALQNRSEIA